MASRNWRRSIRKWMGHAIAANCSLIVKRSNSFSLSEMNKICKILLPIRYNVNDSLIDDFSEKQEQKMFQLNGASDVIKPNGSERRKRKNKREGKN